MEAPLNNPKRVRDLQESSEWEGHTDSRNRWVSIDRKLSDLLSHFYLRGSEAILPLFFFFD